MSRPQKCYECASMGSHAMNCSRFSLNQVTPLYTMLCRECGRIDGSHKMDCSKGRGKK